MAQINTHVISECRIAARDRQKLPDYVDVAVFAGTHERSGAVVIADINLGPARKERSHHVPSTVADREHQRRLTSLKTSCTLTHLHRHDNYNV